jgi:hypothetical protein
MHTLRWFDLARNCSGAAATSFFRFVREHGMRHAECRREVFAVALDCALVPGKDGPSIDATAQQTERMLHDAFEITHVTLQIESEAFAATCELAAARQTACPGIATADGLSRCPTQEKRVIPPQ